MSTENPQQKDPKMQAWTAYWSLYKRKSNTNDNPFLKRGVAQELAVLGHKLINTKWVKHIPIFMELKG